MQSYINFMSVTRVNASTVSMEWYDNILCQQRNSEITTGLQFEIRLVRNSPSQALLQNSTVTMSSIILSQTGEQHTLNFTWLSPGFIYQIRIAAVNAMGQAGPYSNQLSITLPHYNGRIIQVYTYKQHFITYCFIKFDIRCWTYAARSTAP